MILANRCDLSSMVNHNAIRIYSEYNGLHMEVMKEYQTKTLFTMIDDRKTLYTLYPRYLKPFSAYTNKDCIHRIFGCVADGECFTLFDRERIIGFVILQVDVASNCVNMPFFIADFRYHSYRKAVSCIFDFAIRYAQSAGYDTLRWESFPYIAFVYPFALSIGAVRCGSGNFFSEARFGNTVENLYDFVFSVSDYVGNRNNQKRRKAYIASMLDAPSISGNGHVF